MNAHVFGFGLGAALAVFAPAGTVDGAMAAQSAMATRVGIYDSRIVAFAHFWSPAERQQRETRIAAAHAAKAGGDDARHRELSHALAASQKQIHLQVFSTAPALEAMTTLAPRLPALRAELGVDRFISKWDTAALAEITEANRIDVTDRLIREFLDPSPKQQKTIAAMKSTAPMPLWKAKLMAAVGGM